MRLTVYGAGGVGGYFGGRLAQAGADVHLVARGDHLTALKENGLRVDSVHGDFHVDLPATNDPGDIGPCDYVLFTVKSFDTDAAAHRLTPLLHNDTAVISLQNGLDNERKLADEIGAHHVLGGVAYIFSTIAEPGVIAHTGGPAQMIYGELNGERSSRAVEFLEWCQRADGMSAELSEDISTVLWDKTAFICALAGMTAAVRLPLGDIRAVEESWAMYRELLEEVRAVSVAEGVDLSADVVDKWVAFAAEELGPETYSSLHYDLTHGKPMELEALHGAVRRRAADHNVDVPMTDAVYALLRPWAVRNEGVSDRSPVDS